MGYWRLLRNNPKTIGFGFLTTFFSGLGQTHFVSLYGPFIIEKFQLSNTQYGSLYSAVTLVSGFAITFIGPLIDRTNARSFALVIGLGLLLSQSLMFYIDELALVVVAIFGLRLLGQGLCSSLSSITIARYFEAQRGQALSLSQMGYPVYEGLITPLAAFIITTYSLHMMIGFSLALVILFYLPLAFYLTRGLDEFNFAPGAKSSQVQMDHRPSWNRKQALSHPTIYGLIPQVLMPPFALTGLLFHQGFIAELKGWSLSLMASGLFFFAVGRILNTFIAGPLVDRYGAHRLFSFYQLPMAFGFLLLGWLQTTWAPALCFSLFGLTVGAGGPIKSAIWAELYGLKYLGSIKSLFATFMILSTAASPALFGWILDAYHSVGFLMYGLFISCLVSSFLAFVMLASSNSPHRLNH